MSKVMTEYPIQHLSVSSVGAYMMCPRKWKFHYIDNLPAPSSIPQIFGTAFHNTIEAYLQSGHKGDIQTRWEEMWSTAVAENKDITWGDKSSSTELAVGRRMFNSPEIMDSIHHINPLIDDKGRVYIEHFFKYDIPGVDVPFLGYLDVITQERIIGDIKTASSAWDRDKARLDIQPFLYLAGAKANKLDVRDDLFRFYVYIKKNGRAQEIFLEDIGKDKIDWVENQVRSVWAGIKAGAFPASTAYGWWCSAKYCEYWDICGRGG